jgi:hypothetical protein
MLWLQIKRRQLGENSWPTCKQELDELQAAYGAAVDDWVIAIRE